MQNSPFNLFRGSPKPETNRETFKDLDATELYCPSCGRATPVHKRLLLVLPDGDKYEYLCVFCMTSVGTKIVCRQKEAPVVF